MADPFGSALDLAAALRARELSAVEALERCLEAVDRLNPDINAVVWRDDEDARRRAVAADRALAGDSPPPFCGVPIPIKELTPVAGQPVTYGSYGAPDGPAPRSEVCIERLEHAGFVLACRTNSPEFGSITATENLRFGPTRNPWDPERTPGGSSGGAAAAVASGMFPIAHANDGGGSTRIPAAFCGLVGLKPSRGRTPRLAQEWQGAVVEGVETRTVADTAALLDVIGAFDPRAWHNAPPPGRPFAEEPGTDPGRLRIAVLTETPSGLPVDPECVAAATETAEALAGLGHELVEAPAFTVDQEELLTHFYVMMGGSNGAEYEGVDPDKVEPHNRAILELGTQARAVDFARASRYFELLTREIVSAWLTGFDVMVTPTSAMLPPPVGELMGTVHANPTEPALDLQRITGFAAVFNVTGQPAISVPTGWTDSGLPVGVQLVGGPFDEVTILRLAAQLERELPWAERRPSLSSAVGG